MVYTVLTEAIHKVKLIMLMIIKESVLFFCEFVIISQELKLLFYIPIRN